MSQPHTPDAASPVPSCPKCEGPMWDNREGKRNPKAPDFKCKDKNCDGVIWPPQEPKGGREASTRGQAGPYQETGAPPSPTAGYAGPALPGETIPTAADPDERFEKTAILYEKCLDRVIKNVYPKLMAGDVGTTPEAILASCATLFIRCTNRGLDA